MREGLREYVSREDMTDLSPVDSSKLETNPLPPDPTLPLGNPTVQLEERIAPVERKAIGGGVISMPVSVLVEYRPNVKTIKPVSFGRYAMSFTEAECSLVVMASKVRNDLKRHLNVEDVFVQVSADNEKVTVGSV